MAIDTRRITDLYRARNGYAEFTVGSGRNKRYGIIDRDGRIVAEPVFRGFPWRMGIAERYIQCCITSSNNPQYRLFDTENGTWVAIDPNRRPWPIPEHDGLFYTHTQQNRCGIQDQTGRQIIPEKYGRIGHIGRSSRPMENRLSRIRSVLSMYGMIAAVLLPDRTTNGIT